MGEQIVVRIGVDGQIRAETLGIKGARCLDSVELLEDLLDSKAVSSAFTADYEDVDVSRVEVIDDELYGR